MIKQELSRQLHQPPSQEWLDEALTCLEDNPSEQGDSSLIDGLLSARGARNRLDRIKGFVHGHSDNLDNILTMVGIDSRDDVRESIDNWLLSDEHSIARWVARSATKTRQVLINENEIERSFNWVKSHPEHAIAPSVLAALLYHQHALVREFVRTWLKEHLNDVQTPGLLRSFLDLEPGNEADSLADEYATSNVAKPEAQETIAYLIRHGKIRNQNLVIENLMTPAMHGSTSLLAALLAVNKSDPILIGLAKKSIEEGCRGAEVVMAELINIRPSELENWSRQWLVDNRTSPLYASALIYMSSAWHDKKLLEELPIEILRNSGWLLRSAIKCHSDDWLVREAYNAVDKHPNAPSSFMLMGCLTRHRQEASTWIEAWLDEAAAPNQILTGLWYMLSADPKNECSRERLNAWIANQVELGWAVSRHLLQEDINQKFERLFRSVPE